MISRGILSQHNEFIHDPSIYCRVRLDSRHAHNSLVDQSAVHECRVFPNREVFAHFHDGCFCRVDGGEGCIEGEVEFLLAPGLAVLQPGELISVSEDELELEPAFINRHAFPGIHLGVGGEEQLISAALLAHASESFWVPDDKPDVPLETLDVRHERVVLIHHARIITYVDIKKTKAKLVSLLTNEMDMESEDIVEIYRKRWEIELLFKQLKQNFPLRYFYGESANAIKIQIWVTLIANLLLMIMQKRIKRTWSFSGLATMYRIMLMYYVNPYSFFEAPEKDWVKLLEETETSPPEPTLFD